MRLIHEAIVFNVDSRHQILDELTRAFLRHAVRWWYASLTAVQHDGEIFRTEACFHMTLRKFREAVIRKCLSIRKHWIKREHTNLTGVVPEDERKRYGPLAKIQLDGQYTLTTAFTNAIAAAKQAEDAALGRT